MRESRYKICASKEIDYLENYVNDLLDKGWILLGGVTVDSNCNLYQTMVCYEDEEEDKCQKEQNEGED